MLLGAALDAPPALIVGRIAGAALLWLGGACWLARDDGPNRALRGLVAAMLLYNCLAVAVLAGAGAGMRLAGVLMWPAVALHAGLRRLVHRVLAEQVSHRQSTVFQDDE